ncbi:hypothetical protein FC093_19490 [Ilyomonas limi]|uniref:Cthe-2314-like HEPN domain-containing protein n=1 Tax=Ilyomonas limi TaxID=2575867 RepID=A0A4U3KV70_9BACT|nr:hypothetical protein [Ilyomonas limi]TKK65719.1 hypothetical protein FC093_19490 [Ilyomonas limi]
MIKGNQRRSYNFDENSFEQKIIELVGDLHMGEGLEYKFLQYEITFCQAERSLIEESRKYLNEYFEDPENEQESLMYYQDPEHETRAFPLLPALRSAYFIAVHSAFENVWTDICDLYRLYFSKTFIPALNNKYFETINTEERKGRIKIFIDDIIKKYQLLFDYNYIRNSFAHNKPIGEYFHSIVSLINQNKIQHIKILSVDKVEFEITSLQFVVDYCKIIIEFICEIAEYSHNNLKISS